MLAGRAGVWGGLLAAAGGGGGLPGRRGSIPGPASTREDVPQARPSCRRSREDLPMSWWEQDGAKGFIFSSWRNTQELRLQEPVSEQRQRLLGSPWGLAAAPGPTPSGCTSLPMCLPSGQGLLYLKEKVPWQVLALPS